MARAFPGVLSTDRVSIADYAAIDSLDQVSVAFVVNRNGAGTDFGRVFVKASGLECINRASTGNFHLVAGRWGTTDGEWRFSRGTNSTDVRYVITYDHGATTNDPVVYQDGASIAVTDVTAPVGTLAADGDLVIGNRVAADRNLDGTIAEFGWWNRLLSAAEGEAITGEALSPLFFPRGLVLYVPMIRDVVNLVAGSVPSVTGTTVQPHPRVRYPTAVGVGVAVTAAAGSTRPPRFGFSATPWGRPMRGA